MKHVKMFGKSVPLLAIVMVSVLFMGASAMLVDYLSNTAVKEVATVTSPMVVGISYGRESWSTTYCWRADEGLVLSFPEGIDENAVEIHDWDETDWTVATTTVNIVGGETVTLYTMSRNLADALIEGHEEIIISHPEGLTQGDFVTITSRFDSIYGDQGYGRLHTDVGGETTDCYNIDDDNIEIWSVYDYSTWGAGETDVAMWDITFNSAASGTYTFTYRIVPRIYPPEP